MVVKMMKWSPWPTTKRFVVKVKVLRLEGFRGEHEKEKEEEKKRKVLAVAEIKWKGPKGGGFSLRKRERRNISKEGRFVDEGKSVVEFEEEFENVCGFSVSQKDSNSFNAWDVSISILHGYGSLEHQQGGKLSSVGTVSLNLGELASQMQREGRISHLQRELPITLQVAGLASKATLFMSVSFVEIRTSRDSLETLQEPNNNIDDNSNNDEDSNNSGSDNGENNIDNCNNNNNNSEINNENTTTTTTTNNNNMPESFLQRMTSYVSASRRAKKKKKMAKTGPGQQQTEEMSDGHLSSHFSSGDTTDDSAVAFDTEDSRDEEAAPALPQQLGYGSISSAANYTAVEDESAVYYSHGHGSGDEGQLVTRSESSMNSVSRSGLPPKAGGFLSWKKRRLSFRMGRKKDEPLLNKANEEDGGDDIDFARRQIGSSSDEGSSLSKRMKGKPAESEFGDEDFAVGSWEEKELISRDGQSKVKASVFFASIDQRSESAAGESACTVLVAVIANWLQGNRGSMPTKSEFNSLIREGSLEWRKLCDNETYRDCFPDKHFDIDTVLQAKIRPISVASEKSFVGFFRPESFELLQGAMSFDSIWDELSRNVEDGEPQVYIVSWNDHFFVLKVDAGAYYIIDTLGERLFEGCNQAYILKFDDTTLMSRVTENVKDEGKDGVCKENKVKEIAACMEESNNMGCSQDDDQVLCSGRECCREYIKRFLAAIPLEELEAEVKKGMVSGVSLLQRLQIEFHYTATPLPLSLSCSSEATSPMIETNDGS